MVQTWVFLSHGRRLRAALRARRFSSARSGARAPAGSCWSASIFRAQPAHAVDQHQRAGLPPQLRPDRGLAIALLGEPLTAFEDRGHRIACSPPGCCSAACRRRTAREPRRARPVCGRHFAVGIGNFLYSLGLRGGATPGHADGCAGRRGLSRSPRSSQQRSTVASHPRAPRCGPRRSPRSPLRARVGGHGRGHGARRGEHRRADRADGGSW
jgi:hypothetical protein